MDDGFDKALQIAKYKHDLIAIRVTDERELEIPNVGLVKMLDAETGNVRWVDTSNKRVREHFRKTAAKKTAELDMKLNRYGVDMARVYTGKDYVKPLINLFKRREAKK
jgi:hypothetical protein